MVNAALTRSISFGPAEITRMANMSQMRAISLLFIRNSACVGTLVTSRCPITYALSAKSKTSSDSGTLSRTIGK